MSIFLDQFKATFGCQPEHKSALNNHSKIEFTSSSRNIGYFRAVVNENFFIDSRGYSIDRCREISTDRYSKLFNQEVFGIKVDFDGSLKFVRSTEHNELPYLLLINKYEDMIGINKTKIKVYEKMVESGSAWLYYECDSYWLKTPVHLSAFLSFISGNDYGMYGRLKGFTFCLDYLYKKGQEIYGDLCWPAIIDGGSGTLRNKFFQEIGFLSFSSLVRNELQRDETELHFEGKDLDYYTMYCNGNLIKSKFKYYINQGKHREELKSMHKEHFRKFSDNHSMGVIINKMVKEKEKEKEEDTSNFFKRCFMEMAKIKKDNVA